MASKMLGFHGGRTATQSSGDTALDLGISRDADSSAIARLPLNISSPIEDLRLRYLQTDLLRSDNYQVALVPSAKQARHRSFDKPRLSELSPILLLPLTWKELVAEVQAEADHSRLLHQSVVRFGTVCVDFLRMQVSRSHTPVFLTALQFKLLKFFVTSPERVISRDELLNRVWGFNNYPCTRTVDNQVLHLRKKLEPDPAHPTHFQTVHGVGYRFVFETSSVGGE